MDWQFNHTESVFVQIANKLRSEIVSGKYAPNMQIPSVRQLAIDASVNPNTMQKALAVLEEEGLLYTKGTLGRFVTDDEGIIQDARERIKQKAMSTLAEQMKLLCISPDELFDYIKREKSQI